MIHKLTDTLFIHSGFNRIETEIGLLYILNGKKRSFWLVTDKYSIDCQEQIFEQIKDYIRCEQGELFDGTFDKNFNILFHCENISTQEIEQIESDPYAAKKYVLTYKNEQVEKLRIHLRDDFTYEDCVRLITNMELFNQYKSEVNDVRNGEIAILYSLFMKLPFLSFDNSGVADIIPLADKITNSLTQKGLYDWYTQLDIALSLNTDEINQENILNLFKRIANE